MVRETEGALTEFTFPCNEWIESAASGQTASKQIVCGGENPVHALPDSEQLLLDKDKPKEESSGAWTLWATTGKDGDQIKANVFIQVRLIFPTVYLITK